MKRLSLVLAALATATALAGCTGDDGGSPEPAPTTTSSPEAPTSSATEAAEAPRPKAGVCYDLAYDEAVAPTSSAAPVPCQRRHTTLTYAVGDLDALLDGHLMTVDSEHVRQQVAEACPAAFAEFVGGTEDERRLSMLRPVWFTPTVEQSDAGASWYRCDVALLAGDEELAAFSGRLRGALDRDQQRDRFALCGTAAPGSDGFERVPCAAEHRWRAVSIVPFEVQAYPGVDAARAAGEDPCQDAGASASGGSLDYEWGYEWPTAAQWRAGQTYGICWVPGRRD